MSGNKSKRDTISEEDFNTQMAATPASPEEDSPGDSEADAGSEFLMGLNYMPDEKNEFEGSSDEPGEIVFSDRKSKQPEVESDKAVKIPNTAKVVSSDQPAPWSDRDDASDTH